MAFGAVAEEFYDAGEHVFVRGHYRAVSKSGEENFAPHLEVDRTLITGQNPASAVPLAQEVAKTLG